MPIESDDNSPAGRYDRQQRFAALGQARQRVLQQSRALIVGLGGLGSHLAELLARMGVGMLRLVDDDTVDWTNLARQSLYTQADADARTAKTQAAADALARINSTVSVETRRTRLGADNIESLAGDVDLILDGTDDLPTRFVINDYAVRTAKPWVYAGVVEAHGVVAPFSPGKTACLRCLYEQPPDTWPRAQQVGVLPTAVAAIAAIAATEAVKLLVDAAPASAASPPQTAASLLSIDLWTGRTQRLDISRPRSDCPCCAGHVARATRPTN